MSKKLTKQEIWEQSQDIGRWTETMMKVFARMAETKLWHFVSFRGPQKCESQGIVDVVAIRKNHKLIKPPLKRGDLFEIILIQLKGGNSRKPTPSDIERMKKVASYYRAKDIVLFEWLKYKKWCFYVLKRNKWVETEPEIIFK